MSVDIFRVTVGNIGEVFVGRERDARETFDTYVEQSKSERGRAGGEDVTLWRNGEPIKEFWGSLSSSDMS